MTVKTESSLYEDVLRFKPDELSLNAWALRAGVNRTVWSDMRRHGNSSRRTIEKLMRAIGSSPAEFEALRIGWRSEPSGVAEKPLVGDAGARQWRPAPRQPVPVFATSMNGLWGEAGSQVERIAIGTTDVVATVPRPDALVGDADAYAVTIVGDSMWPRFRPGRRIFVSPRAPVAIGDDVILWLAEGSGKALSGALVKELVRRSAASVELRQHNPGATFKVDATQFTAIHKVVGEVY
jgi:SOS-response transcriptional repressor LexA